MNQANSVAKDEMNQTDAFMVIDSQLRFVFFGCMVHGCVFMCITLQRR